MERLRYFCKGEARFAFSFEIPQVYMRSGNK